jgi:hypothetical protein
MGRYEFLANREYFRVSYNFATEMRLGFEPGGAPGKLAATRAARVETATASRLAGPLCVHSRKLTRKLPSRTITGRLYAGSGGCRQSAPPTTSEPVGTRFIAVCSTLIRESESAWAAHVG